MFRLHAEKNNLTVVEKEPLVTSGSVNVYLARFVFNETDWDGLTKTAVFKCADTSISVGLTEDDANFDEELKEKFYICSIPWECLQFPNRTLYIGVMGTMGQEIVLPTIWADCGDVKLGVTTADAGIDIPPNKYDELKADIKKKGDALDYDGVNLDLMSDGKIISTVQIVGGSGGEGGGEAVVPGVTSFNGRKGRVEPEIGDYTAEMVGALPADTTIPEVPDWAQQKEKPTYTYNEVGADKAGSAELVKRELISDIDGKLDKSGGTVAGDIVFASQVSTRTSYEDGSGVTSNTAGEEEQQPYGLRVYSDGIYKETDGPFHISGKEKTIDFSDETGNATLIGVVGNEKITNSVPNMGQMKAAIDTASKEVEDSVKASIPTKTSQLENDSKFVDERYVADAIENIEGGEGVVGPPGPAGTDGKDGFSPTVTTTPNAEGDGTTVTITDVNGQHTFEVLNGLNGKDGENGANGAPGAPGENGANGFSPTISTTPNEDNTGTTVSITDVDGTKSFEVLNGKDGKDGKDGAEGPQGPAGSDATVNAGDGLSKDGDTLSVTTPVQGILSNDEFEDLPESQRNKGLYIIPDAGEGGGESNSGGGVPSGCILMWSGTEDNIPDGWTLCNGENGAPDLRGRFVLCSSEKYAVGSVGGQEEVTLTVEQMPEHNHALNAVKSVATSGGYCVVDNISSGQIARGTTTKRGNSKPHPNMPPYYALCYIVKL